MLDVFDFGKNTVFILSCYGLSAGVILALIVVTLHARKLAKQQLAEIIANTE